MASWERELRDAAEYNDVITFNAILSKVEVRRDGNFGRREWNWGEAPLHTAVALGRTGMIRQLVGAGFDVDSYDVSRNVGFVDQTATSLHLAVWSRKASALRLLLDLGADRTLVGCVPTWYSGTPLQWAEQIGDPGIVRILREHPGRKEPPTFITSFDTMDLKAKVMQKAHKAKELEEANKIKMEIENKKAQIATIKEDMKNKNTELETLEEEVKKLGEQPGFVHMNILERQVDEIENIISALKEVNLPSQNVTNRNKGDCPVCFEPPQKIFSCQECDGWVCQDCGGQFVSCPTCRQDLAEKPLRRNRTAERILQDD